MFLIFALPRVTTLKHSYEGQSHRLQAKCAAVSCCCRKGSGQKCLCAPCLWRKINGYKEQTCFLRKSASEGPLNLCNLFAAWMWPDMWVDGLRCCSRTGYRQKWRHWQITSVSLVWFIPETLLQLLGKELLLRECSKFFKVSGDKTFHKNAILASGQNPLRSVSVSFELWVIHGLYSQTCEFLVSYTLKRKI